MPLRAAARSGRSGSAARTLFEADAAAVDRRRHAALNSLHHRNSPDRSNTPLPASSVRKGHKIVCAAICEIPSFTKDGKRLSGPLLTEIECDRRALSESDGVSPAPKHSPRGPLALKVRAAAVQRQPGPPTACSTLSHHSNADAFADLLALAACHLQSVRSDRASRTPTKWSGTHLFCVPTRFS
jgi:hypothetical protein